MAQFVVLSEDSCSVHIRDCIRIAKKSLIFSQPVNGKTQIPKHRCYYYDVTKNSLFEAMLRLRTKEDILTYLQTHFRPVTIKSTRF